MKTRSMLAVALSVILLASAALAADSHTPNLAGHWRLDPLNSTGDTTRHGNLIISQMGDQVEVQYYTGTSPAGNESFTADGKQRERYRMRVGTAFSRVRWEKGAMVITTQTALNNEGTQSYTEIERWSVSPDGKKLTIKYSDGKFLIYNKQVDTPSADAK